MKADHQAKAHPLAVLFLENRHLLVLFVLIAMVGGLSALKSLPRLEDPIITNRNPIIITAFPGASADRVESLVTEPIERELKEIPEIKYIDTTSRAGISMVAIELDDAVTTEENKQIFSEIRDALADAAATFPREVRPPEFDDKRNAIAFTLITAIRWTDRAEDKLGVLTRQAEALADRLRSVAGTELVRIYGGAEEEIAVAVDADELAALGLSIQDVSASMQRADSKVPSGMLRGPEADLLLEVTGELDSLARVRAVPLLIDETSGRTVRMGDVAQVTRSQREPAGSIALADGSRAVYVAARVQGDRRVDQWAQAANAAVDEFRSGIGGGIEVDVLFDQNGYTSDRLGELSGNLLLGALVVLAVVFVTMGWRSSLIVGLALPLTASLTLFVVALNGGKLHQMSIFGMIIALGLLIDNAIVMTDEVKKNLGLGKSPVDAFSAAIRHLFLPLLSSTLTTMLAFMPILLLPGGAGDFVGSIAGSVIVALGASFLVAMTVIGALAGLFGQAPRVGGKRAILRDGIGGEGISQRAAAVMRVLIGRPLLGIACAAALPVLGFVLAQSLGSQFFPRTDRNMFEVEVYLPTDSSLSKTRQVAGEIEGVIREREQVERVDWLVGGSFPSVYYNLIMNQDGSRHFAHGIVTATDFESVDGMISNLQAEIDDRFPGAQVVLRKFAQGRRSRPMWSCA